MSSYPWISNIDDVEVRVRSGPESVRRSPARRLVDAHADLVVGFSRHVAIMVMTLVAIQVKRLSSRPGNIRASSLGTDRWLTSSLAMLHSECGQISPHVHIHNRLHVFTRPTKLSKEKPKHLDRTHVCMHSGSRPSEPGGKHYVAVGATSHTGNRYAVSSSPAIN